MWRHEILLLCWTVIFYCSRISRRNSPVKFNWVNELSLYETGQENILRDNRKYENNKKNMYTHTLKMLHKSARTLKKNILKDALKLWNSIKTHIISFSRFFLNYINLLYTLIVLAYTNICNIKQLNIPKTFKIQILF